MKADEYMASCISLFGKGKAVECSRTLLSTSSATCLSYAWSISSVVVLFFIGLGAAMIHLYVWLGDALLSLVLNIPSVWCVIYRRIIT